MRMMLAARNQTVAQPGPQDIALDVIRRMQAPVFTPSSVPVEKHKGPGGILGALGKVMPFVAPGSWALMKGTDTSPGRAVLDALSRPTYAVAGWSSEYNKEQERAMQNYSQDGGTVADEIISWARPLVSPKPYEGFKQGLTGETRKTNADVIREQHPGVGNKTAGIG